MSRIKTELDEQELRRICEILEEMASRSETTADEMVALETAAIALMSVNLARYTQAAYKKLAEAHNGAIPEPLKADLREHGFDIDALESDND